MAKIPSTTDRDAFWLEHLRRCGRGSMKDYADANGLDVGTLYAAKARLKRAGRLAAGAPPRLVRVEAQRTSSPTLCRIALPNGVCIELACAPTELASLLATAAALP